MRTITFYDSIRRGPCDAYFSDVEGRDTSAPTWEKCSNLSFVGLNPNGFQSHIWAFMYASTMRRRRTLLLSSFLQSHRFFFIRKRDECPIASMRADSDRAQHDSGDAIIEGIPAPIWFVESTGRPWTRLEEDTSLPDGRREDHRMILDEGGYPSEAEISSRATLFVLLQRSVHRLSDGSYDTQ